MTNGSVNSVNRRLKLLTRENMREKVFITSFFEGFFQVLGSTKKNC